jgi:hypothetical protein
MKKATIGERSICIPPTLVLAALLACSLARGQKNDQTDVMFQAAFHKQLVDGDLEGAIEQYKTILAKYGSDRAVAAKAWVEMGQCYEKLGKEEARKAYERVLRDYADQSEAAAKARTRLAALSGNGASRSSEMATRRVWAGPDVDVQGSVSPDRRYLSYVDWTTGDLAIRDLVTGKVRHLTNNTESSGNAFFRRYRPMARRSPTSGIPVVLLPNCVLWGSTAPLPGFSLATKNWRPYLPIGRRTENMS